MKQPPRIFVATSAALLDAGMCDPHHGVGSDAGSQQGGLPLARLAVVPPRPDSRTPGCAPSAVNEASAVILTKPASPVDAPAPVQLPDSIVMFWDELFCAVRTRLRQTVDASSRGHGGGDGVEDSPAAARRMRDSVLDCVAALDQLHAALTHEAGRSRRIEQALAHAHAELDRVRLELAGTQAGLSRSRAVAPQDGAAAAPRPVLFRVPAPGGLEPAAVPVVLPGTCVQSGYSLLHGGTLR